MVAQHNGTSTWRVARGRHVCLESGTGSTRLPGEWHGVDTSAWRVARGRHVCLESGTGSIRLPGIDSYSYSFIQVVVITGLKKLSDCMFSP